MTKKLKIGDQVQLLHTSKKLNGKIKTILPAEPDNIIEIELPDQAVHVFVSEKDIKKEE